jgi:hypothetical protein
MPDSMLDFIMLVAVVLFLFRKYGEVVGAIPLMVLTMYY